MRRTTTSTELHDYEPPMDDFRAEVLAGLLQDHKSLPCKYFYDAPGSLLFDEICELEEYYPTRTEASIMCDNLTEMAAVFGPDCGLIEYGSGSSTKTRLLLDALPQLGAYIPVDISREHLLNSAHSLEQRYPGLPIIPVCADYTKPFALPAITDTVTHNIVYFPGSTIGNFPPHQAVEFLKHMAVLSGEHGGILIGVDLKKPPQILEPAYNDRLGITAQFNLNLLARINRELEGDFALEHWEHYACYNPFRGRIEMHLISLRNQQVHIGETPICFDQDEMIFTECSYKYSIEEFAALASEAGLRVDKVWTDSDQRFSVQYLTGNIAYPPPLHKNASPSN